MKYLIVETVAFVGEFHQMMYRQYGVVRFDNHVGHLWKKFSDYQHGKSSSALCFLSSFNSLSAVAKF